MEALQLKIDTTFPFKWKEIPTAFATNPYIQYYELDKYIATFRTMEDNFKTACQDSGVKTALKKLVDSGIKVYPHEMNRALTIRLGDYVIPDDLQRILDCPHLAGILNNFNSSCLGILMGIVHSKMGPSSSDAQHTATLIALLVHVGIFVDENGNKYDNWQDYEYQMWGRESDSFAVCRIQFQTSNGDGKKPQTKYMKIKNQVKTVRIDGDTSNKKYVEIEKKLSLAESYGCYPLSDKFANTDFPNCFSHIAGFVNSPIEAVDLACKYQSTYFYNDELNSVVWSFWRQIQSQFSLYNIQITDKLMYELASLVQRVFKTNFAFKEAVDAAFKEWNAARGVVTDKKREEAAYGPALIQMYKAGGGTEQVPRSMMQEYVSTDVINNITYALIKYIDEAKKYYVV
jgi:hypothetical protein